MRLSMVVSFRRAGNLFCSLSLDRFSPPDLGHERSIAYRGAFVGTKVHSFVGSERSHSVRAEICGLFRKPVRAAHENPARPFCAFARRGRRVRSDRSDPFRRVL
jgi:hypothetical protein